MTVQYSHGLTEMSNKSVFALSLKRYIKGSDLRYREEVFMSALRLLLSLAFALAIGGWLPSGSRAAEPENQTEPGPQKALTLEAKQKELTVDDSVRNALENHPSIKQAAEKVGAQAAVLRQQFAAYYPTLSLNGQYQTGTQSGSTSVAPEAFDSFQAQASVNMTLYNFGKREGAVQSARDTLSATQYNLKTTADTVVLGVKQAYYSYLQAIALVRVREETVRDRDLVVRQAQAFFDVGTRAKIDLVRAQSNLYSAQSDLIAAQNTMRVAWATLKNAMGLPDIPEQAVASIPAAQVQNFAVTTFPLNLEQARSQAFDIRPELLSFKAQLRAQDQITATNRRGHLPDIIFDASYARRNTSNQEHTTVKTGSDCVPLKDADDTCTIHLGHFDTFPLQPSWQVRLTLNIPIFDGFRTTYKVEESVRTYYAIRAAAEQQKQQVALEVEQGYANVGSAQERIKATRAAEQAARENLDLANGRYQVGVGSIIEVTDAQALYVTAEVDYVNSLYNYKIAEAQLLRAVGTP
jgi:outer membrane protein